LGAAQDRKPAPARLEEEGTQWRTGCAGASVLPAIALGVLAGVVTRGTIFGREREYHYNIENDPDGWSALPAVLTGLCVSVEVVTIGYHIGCAIDRREAEQAEAKRRALGREAQP
jgi:cytochrome bd-type quinol oxidase subunit 2